MNLTLRAGSDNHCFSLCAPLLRVINSISEDMFVRVILVCEGTIHGSNLLGNEQ